MERKRLVLQDPIFHATVYVQIGGTDQEAVDWFSSGIRADKVFLNYSTASGKFFENSAHHGGCIWIKNRADKLALIHESLHAVHYIMRRMRIELREDSEEFFCYYQEWLLREISRRAGLKL